MVESGWSAFTPTARIKGHNVVIACLPEGEYGTNNAANVMANLNRSFPKIRVCLMVGIGGGAPCLADIRLGDVVVGSRVMQYDLGKVIQAGDLKRTAIFKMPPLLLRTAVTALRDKHDGSKSSISAILKDKFGDNSDYGRPDSLDRLFSSAYDHISPAPNCRECESCDQSRLVPRSVRRTDEPHIHYGAMASGNQVMRSASQRDSIARELDVMCFEMEAAGLMGNFPCLPIRGICDYSDSHKSKTCPDYNEWLKPEMLAEHHGLLWIRGKPGAGKSTLMKYLHTNTSRTRGRQTLIACFFFNARGDQLERSLEGMHRSLLLQLLRGHPELQSVLDDLAVLRLGRRQFTCFIDALDECDEQQVMDMVDYFEDLTAEATDAKRGIKLTLEDQQGHTEDLANYVASRLRIHNRDLKEELQPKLIEKASGVFLWVVLVVDVLNKEYAREVCVIGTSKGLAEITKTSRPTVQFIHESVRDFLLKAGGLQELWPGLGFDWKIPSHERLKTCCHAYLNHPLVHEPAKQLMSQVPRSTTNIPSRVPFLEYANQHMLYHADIAAEGIVQHGYLSGLAMPDWTHVANHFEKYESRKYTPNANILYILADRGYSKLIRNWLQNHSPDIVLPKERYKRPLFAALAHGHKDAVAVLLGLNSTILDGEDVTDGLGLQKTFGKYAKRTPLTWAAQEGRLGIVKILLQGGANDLTVHVALI
ncbi:purine and uridine phosphorylase [Colletotrichum sublineola]|nr:purine and uridine phosphorylase [Colletotrichum sublineola]